MRTEANPLDPDKLLSCTELAAMLGSRRAGRPTHPETIRGWMVRGLAGVLLWCEWDLGMRRTTWNHFLAFRSAVARAKEEQRRERLEYARAGITDFKQRRFSHD